MICFLFATPTNPYLGGDYKLMSECPYCKKTAVYFIDKVKSIFIGNGLECIECGGKLSLYIDGMLLRIYLSIFTLIVVFGFLILKEWVFMPLPVIIGALIILTIHYFIPLRVPTKRI